MDFIYNKHYIQTNERGEIVNGFSDAFRQPSDTDICINDKGGYQFRLFPDGEENPPLFDFPSMIPLYKYADGEVVERTEEELAADHQAWQEEQGRLAAMPTREDRIEAQVTFTAMMTDTLLPEEDEDDV